MAPSGIGGQPGHVAVTSSRAFVAAIPVPWHGSTMTSTKLIAMPRIAI